MIRYQKMRRDGVIEGGNGGVVSSGGRPAALTEYLVFLVEFIIFTELFSPF